MMQVVPDYVGIIIYALETSKKETRLANSAEDVLFTSDVARIKRDVMVSLDNVEHRDNVGACEELFNNVSTDEAAATNDEVDIFLLSRHCDGERQGLFRHMWYDLFGHLTPLSPFPNAHCKLHPLSLTNYFQASQPRW